MAKNVGLIGSVSGKIGNVVYAVTNGVQIARVYQPVVSNPKSPLQNAQRAKGNIAGRISSLTPRTVIMGLGGNNRARRGAYLRELLRAATVTSSGGVYTAKVDGDDIVFSKGSVVVPVNYDNATTSAHRVQIVLRGVGAGLIPPEVYASCLVRLVAVVYDSTTQEMVEIATNMAQMPQQSGASESNIPIAHNGGFIADIYAIPMRTSDGSAIAISTSQVGLSDSDIAATLTANGNNVVFDYGNSMLFGQAIYTPA